MNMPHWAMACAAAMLASPVGAAVQPPQQVQVVGTKYDQRRDDTASAIVIGSEELTRHGDRSLADALVRVPGITVGAGGIRLRGLGNGYTQVLLDGVPMPAGFALESLAPELIERIDIVKTASAELGMQGIAGTVNIVMKKRVARTRDSLKLGLDRQRGYHSPSLSGQFATKGERYSSSVAATLGRTRVLTSSIDRESSLDGDWLTATERVTARHELNTRDALSLVPHVAWKLGGGDQLSLRGLFNLDRRQARGENHETVLAGERSAIPDSALAFRPSGYLAQLDLGWERSLEGGAKLELKAGATGNRRKSAFTFIALPRATAETTFVDSQVNEDGWHAGAKYSVMVGGKHQLVAGWESATTERDQTRSGNDVEAQSQLRVDRYRGTITRTALFVQDDWRGDAGWSVSAGVRADLLGARVVQAGEPTVDQRTSMLSPVLQALYKPDLGGQFRLGLTRTYKAPTMSALIPRRYKADNNNNPSNPDTQGNPALRAELAWGIDAGYEHYFGNKAMLSASAFARRIDDVTVWQLERDQYGWVMRQLNQGRADASGVLLEAKFPVTAWWPASPAIDVRVSAARNWSRIDAIAGPGNRLDGQDRSSVNLAVDYKPAAMPLTLAANFNYRGGASVRRSERATSGASPARVLDLHAVWTLRRDARLRVGALNLLRQDAMSALFYVDGQSASRTTVAAKGSVSLRLGLEIDLD